MHANNLIALLSAFVLVCGCDPGGLRRVQLELPGPNDGRDRIAVDSADVRRHGSPKHGFHVSDDQQRYVRVYSKSVNPDGLILKCHLRMQPRGIEVTFGEYGFSVGNPGAEDLFMDARATLIQRYGRKNVKSPTMGSPR